MKGYGQAIGNRPDPSIRIHRGRYVIDWYDYEMTATSTELANFTRGVLRVFGKLEKASRQDVTLDEGFCRAQLAELAKWGKRAYRRFFTDTEARALLAERFESAKARPTPTFISEEFLFPWEVLTEGALDGFWGVRYAPARILEPRRRRFVEEHALPLDMLFCLHDQLRAAHSLERAALERWFRAGVGRFRLLGPILAPFLVCDGESLLRYLVQAHHNMLHFACHCKLNDDQVDTLLVSLIDEKSSEQRATLVELESYHFLDVETAFQRQPLVFLNACQSAGGSTALQQTFNLPRHFIKRHAAAVVATACPVPDLFAAEFAKHFYERFLGGQEVEDERTGVKRRVPIPIGEALRLTRQHFIEEHHNPLGLAYGLYSPAYYRLAQIPAYGG